MGTDIHGVWQRKDNGLWVDIESNYEQQRHYQLFAVLAGVRNGTGFAGVPIGEAVTPIAEPRGLPAFFNVNNENEHPVQVLEHMDPRRRKWRKDEARPSVWMGDHSLSWLTGAEMLAWLANAPVVTKCGIIDRKDYVKWDKVSCPQSYCGGISGPGVIVIDVDDAPDINEWEGWTHVRVNWKSSLKDELSYFFDEVARLVELHGEIRFVFGFDS